MLCLGFTLSPLDNYEEYSLQSMSLVLLQLKNFSSTWFSRQYFFTSSQLWKKKLLKSSISGTKRKQRQKL